MTGEPLVKSVDHIACHGLISIGLSLLKTFTTGRSCIGIQFPGKEWEQLRSVNVDAVGEFTYILKPKREKFHDRLLCEVVIEGNVKVVTLRSTFKVVNTTMYPLEIMLVDPSGRPTYPVQKLGA